MRLRKRTVTLAIAILSLFMIGMTVFADEIPDSSRRGSISLTMTYDGIAVPGGTLMLYRVGAVSEEDGNHSFVLTGDFADGNQEVADISSSDFAKKLAEYAESRSLSGREVNIDGGGNAVFSDLELGLYLIVQEEAAEGYETVVPFLVSVPITENGSYLYDVDASPKIELKKNETTTPPVAPPSDTPDPVLPQTGQLNWPVPVLTVIGLLLFSIGWSLRFRQKGEQP